MHSQTGMYSNPSPGMYSNHLLPPNPAYGPWDPDGHFLIKRELEKKQQSFSLPTIKVPTGKSDVQLMIERASKEMAEIKKREEGFMLFQKKEREKERTNFEKVLRLL